MAASKGMYLAYLFQALIAVNAAIAFVTGQYTRRCSRRS